MTATNSNGLLLNGGGQTKPKRRESLGARLRRQGFDRTRYERSGGYYQLSCSQCEAITINGVACHETGCPNARRSR